MKKKISLILALAMTAAMLAGCKKTDEDSAGLPDVGSDSSMSSLTQMTTTTTETTTEETTTTTEETTTEESESETSETTSDTTASETTATASATTAGKAWNETEISETYYIKTSCYSRKEAIVGSESVKKYDVGQKINIVAATDTGYYKLADGTFIHSDYVTDEKPAAETTAASTTAKKEETDSGKKPSKTPSHVNSSYNKSYEDRYPYQQLNDAEKELYADIVEAAENFESEIMVPEGLTSDDIFKIYCLVYNQEPQLFWMSNSVPIALGGMMQLEFDLTPEEAEETQKRIDATVSEVMSKVNSYTSTVSKLKVIYDWVVTNNNFSLQGNYKTCGIYNGLTGNGELQCQGYAKSVLYLCDVAGIDCMVVTGNNTSGDTHAWNVVYCDNGYYVLDTTWGDPYGLAYAKSSYARYLFFLANDEMIENSHLNISTFARGNGKRIKLYDPPACTKSACYYFKAYNKEFSDVDSAVQGMYAEIDAALEAGKNVAHIRVTDHEIWETLRSNSYWKAFQDYAKKKDGNVKEIKRQTTLTEDVLVVQYDIAYND